MRQRHQDPVTHAGIKGGAHHGPAGWGYDLCCVGDVGVVRQRFGIQRNGVVAIRGNERHDGIAAEVGFDARLVRDVCPVGARCFHQRDGLTQRLAQGDAVGMGNDATLHPDVHGLLVFVLADPTAHLAVGRLVIGVHAAGITAAGTAQPLLDIPVQVVFLQRRAVQADVLRRTVFGVVQVVGGPGVMHPVVQRHRDAQRELVVVRHLITVFITVAGVFVHAVTEAVAHAVPAVVVADAHRGHVLALAPVGFLHHAEGDGAPAFGQRLVDGGFCAGAALLRCRPVVRVGIRLHGVVQGVKAFAVIAVTREREVGARTGDIFAVAHAPGLAFAGLLLFQQGFGAGHIDGERP